MKGNYSTIPAPASSLKHLLRAALQRPSRWLELHRQRRQLASLSDATLHDLGLSRADIHLESERHFWDDPLHK